MRLKLRRQHQRQYASIAAVVAALLSTACFAQTARREYVDLMLEIQYKIELAQRAGICQLRDYLPRFLRARDLVSQAEIERLRLSPAEAAAAMAEVNRRFAEARVGIPDFDLVSGCKFLRTSSMLAELDRFNDIIIRNTTK